MKFEQSMYVWDPDGEIMIVEHPDVKRRSETFSMSGGACYSKNHNLHGPELIAQIFIDFHHIVVRDGVDPRKAHKAFMNIDEYRKALAPDCIDID